MEVGLVFLIYLVGLVLLFLELFVPGAFLGVLGVGMVIAGIVLAFLHHSQALGLALVGVALVVVPVVLIWVLKRTSLNTSQNLEDGFTSTEEKFDDLVSKEGTTLTPLRPSGVALIEGRRIDVTAEAVMIGKDTPIKVVKVEGSRVVVKATGAPRVEE